MPPPEAAGEAACSEACALGAADTCLLTLPPAFWVDGPPPRVWAPLPSKGTLTAVKLSPGDVPPGRTELRERQLGPDGGGVGDVPPLGGQSPRN